MDIGSAHHGGLNDSVHRIDGPSSSISFPQKMHPPYPRVNPAGRPHNPLLFSSTRFDAVRLRRGMMREERSTPNRECNDSHLPRGPTSRQLQPHGTCLCHSAQRRCSCAHWRCPCFVACLATLGLLLQLTLVSHIVSMPAFTRLVRGAYFEMCTSYLRLDSDVGAWLALGEVGILSLKTASALPLSNIGPSAAAVTASMRRQDFRLALEDAARAVDAAHGRCQLEPHLLWHDAEALGENHVEAQKPSGSTIPPLLRCLPNVLFIGASKCGTSSMRSHLAAHPTIRFVARMQSQAEGAEIHRFDRPDYGTS